MNHLTVAMPNFPDLKITDENTRYSLDQFGLDIKETKSSIQCCVCTEAMWIVIKFGGTTLLLEGFKVIDSRAYIHGTPDYLKASNLLLECHYKCKEELVSQLNDKTFIRK